MSLNKPYTGLADSQNAKSTAWQPSTQEGGCQIPRRRAPRRGLEADARRG